MSGSAFASASDDANACAANPKQAVEVAQKALVANEPERDRAALICLVRAVAALDAKLDDLIAGRIEFTGDVVAPAFLHTTKDDEGTK